MVEGVTGQTAVLGESGPCPIRGVTTTAPTYTGYRLSARKGRVLFSEPERAAFRRLLDTGLCDTFRLFDQDEKSFSWWDYRMNAFKRNLGARIDHILASTKLSNECRACWIDKEPRKRERPSDHTPVVAEFDLT